MDFNSSLKRLEKDANVFEMALHVIDEGEIDVFIKNLSFSNVMDLVMPKKSGVVIEEIIECNAKYNNNSVQICRTKGRQGKCSENRITKGSGSRLNIGWLANKDSLVDMGNDEVQPKANEAMHIASPIYETKHASGHDDEVAVEGGDEMDVNSVGYDGDISDCDNRVEF